MNNTQVKRKTALVTGASRGIGAELARLLAREGHDLVLVARDEKKLNELADELRKTFKVEAKVLVKDLSRPNAPEEIYREAVSIGRPVEVLVNNAGFGTHGLFHETSLEAELEMIQVNMAALTHLTKLFLRPMLERKQGKILNVSSLAAYVPGPLMAVYFATKACVLSFSEALAEELRGTGVTVTCLCPGSTETEFFIRAGMEPVRRGALRLPRMDPAKVAQEGYRALMRGDRVVVTGFHNWWVAVVTRLFPRGWSAWVFKKFQGLQGIG